MGASDPTVVAHDVRVTFTSYSGKRNALAAADDPATEPEDRGPAVDEATPEQPVIQRSGTPLVDDGADATADLSTVEVVGRTESGAYQADEAAGAKTDLPLRELPQSVRVVTRQAIDDLGATRLDDVLDYVGGVSRRRSSTRSTAQPPSVWKGPTTEPVGRSRSASA